MFRDDRVELAHIHVERFTGTVEAEDQSALPVIRTSGPFGRLVIMGVSGVRSWKRIGGTSVYGDGGWIEGGEGGHIRGWRWKRACRGL